jgi:hypothetical protein
VIKGIYRNQARSSYIFAVGLHILICQAADQILSADHANQGSVFLIDNRYAGYAVFTHALEYILHSVVGIESFYLAGHHLGYFEM